MLCDSSGGYPITNPKALVFVFINHARSEGLLSQIEMSPCSYEYISNKYFLVHLHNHYIGYCSRTSSLSHSIVIEWQVNNECRRCLPSSKPVRFYRALYSHRPTPSWSHFP